MTVVIVPAGSFDFRSVKFSLFWIGTGTFLHSLLAEYQVNFSEIQWRLAPQRMEVVVALFHFHLPP